MRQPDEKGFTLVEMLISLAILAIIATASIPLLSTCLEVYAQSSKRSQLYQEGLMAMERMTDRVRLCTYIGIPNAHKPVRNLLSVSGFINDDDDYFFDDPLFPRIDEDLWRDMNDDGKHGIAGCDDDGDGSIDETFFGFWDYDDDEDGVENEDDLDGLDNDGDGNIDEDTWADLNLDWAPGIKGIDDDGDGMVDEGEQNDDDEDGELSEDPLNEVIYWIPSGTTLREDYLSSGDKRVLTDHVSFFEVQFIAPGIIQIELTLKGDDGSSMTLAEIAYARNTFQKTGKRVR